MSNRELGRSVIQVLGLYLGGNVLGWTAADR